MGRRGLLLLLLSVAALAAGCGGDDETSTTVSWADGVCTAITTWTDSISSATESLRADGAVEDRVEAAVDDVKEATDTLADDLEGLGRPETDAGAQAEDALDTLADDVQRGIETIETAADDVSGASEALTAVSTISATLVTMGELVSSTFEELEQLDTAGELEDAFEEADSCADLRSGSS